MQRRTSVSLYALPGRLADNCDPARVSLRPLYYVDDSLSVCARLVAVKVERTTLHACAVLNRLYISRRKVGSTYIRRWGLLPAQRSRRLCTVYCRNVHKSTCINRVDGNPSWPCSRRGSGRAAENISD